MKKQLFFLSLLIFSSLTSFSQELISAEKIAEKSQAELNTAFGFPIFSNGIKHYKVTYSTLDVHGVKDTASGLIVIPEEAGGEFGKAYPLLCFQHGTVNSRTDVPSNLQGGVQLAEIWGGLGFITFAADYLGMGTSRGFHPYVHAESEASAAFDLMSATQIFLENEGLNHNEQIFVTGYSQGGHGAAAFHKYLEEHQSANYPVTASAPMSGPYSISGAMKDFLYKKEPYFFPGYIPNTLISYETAYGNIYDDLTDVFKPEYAVLIQNFIDEKIGLFGLNTQLISKLTQDFGAPITLNMMNDDLVDEIETNPNHPINIAMRDNDLTNWIPKAPTRLYYCTADDQVTFKNSVIADSIMNALGAADTEAIDVNPTADHGECVTPAMIQAISFFRSYQRIDLILDTHDPSLEKAFFVFPNPTDGAIFIKTEKHSGQALLIDLTGKTVFGKKLTQGKNEINTSGLSKGVYFLKINSEDSFFTKKVILK